MTWRCPLILTFALSVLAACGTSENRELYEKLRSMPIRDSELPAGFHTVRGDENLSEQYLSASFQSVRFLGTGEPPEGYIGEVKTLIGVPPELEGAAPAIFVYVYESPGQASAAFESADLGLPGHAQREISFDRKNLSRPGRCLDSSPEFALCIAVVRSAVVAAVIDAFDAGLDEIDLSANAVALSNAAIEHVRSLE